MPSSTIRISKYQAECYDRMLMTLRQIAGLEKKGGYMTPAQLRKDKLAGISYEDYLEMSYENIQETARTAIKSVPKIRIIKEDKPE